MKKLIVTLSLVLTLGLCANAQSDAFFSYSDASNQERNTIVTPGLPGQNILSDQAAPVPVGSGLLLLAGMGVAYALRRRNN